MGRPARYIPEIQSGVLVEVSCRAIGGRASTRVTKRSPRPLFHAASKQTRTDLLKGLFAYQSQFQIASEALRHGNLKAVGWFPQGCFPPAFPFNGAPPPKRPVLPPTRRITKLESGGVERGEIPMVEIPIGVVARARGRPP